MKNGRVWGNFIFPLIFILSPIHNSALHVQSKLKSRDKKRLKYLSAWPRLVHEQLLLIFECQPDNHLHINCGTVFASLLSALINYTSLWLGVCGSCLYLGACPSSTPWVACDNISPFASRARALWWWRTASSLSAHTNTRAEMIGWCCGAESACNGVFVYISCVLIDAHHSGRSLGRVRGRAGPPINLRRLTPTTTPSRRQVKKSPSRRIELSAERSAVCNNIH